MTTCITKFFLNIIDLRREQWHNKAAFVLCVEFAEDTLRFLTLISFFATVLTYYGLPYHLIRRINISYRSFYRKFLSVMNYLMLMRHINSFPPATQEELQNVGMCIICRVEMEDGQKLPCGHIFHSACFRGWLGRSHECPICRRSLIELIQAQQNHQNHPVHFPNQPMGNIPNINQFQFQGQFQQPPQFQQVQQPQPQPQLQPIQPIQPIQPPSPQVQPNVQHSPQRQAYQPSPFSPVQSSPLRSDESRDVPPEYSSLLETTSLQLQQVDQLASQLSQVAEELHNLKNIILQQQSLIYNLPSSDRNNNNEERIPKDDDISGENDIRKRRLLRFSQN